MRKVYTCKNLFQQQLIEGLTGEYQNCCLLTNYSDSGTFDMLLAVGVIDAIELEVQNGFEGLKKFYESKNDWLFGYLSYDLKNEIENLSSRNFDGLNFPALHFFQPQYVFIFKNEKLEVHYPSDYLQSQVEIFLEKILNPEPGKSEQKKLNLKLNIKSRITKEDYLKSVSSIKHHIKQGDIY